MDEQTKKIPYLKGFNDGWADATNGRDMGTERLHRAEYTAGYIMGRAVHAMAV